MDFSSPERALQSISRRHPPLENDIVELCKNMLNGAIERSQGALQLLKATNHHDRWEPLAVGLYLGSEFLKGLKSDTNQQEVYVDGPRAPIISPDKNDASSKDADGKNVAAVTEENVINLARVLLSTCKQHLEHSEPRVRTLVAKAVGVVIGLNKPDIWQDCYDLHCHIWNSIQNLLKEGRDVEGKHSTSSEGALDDTTGWRSLETNWQSLASYIAAAGPLYFEHHDLNEEFLEACLYSSVEHVNRHVRAAAIQVLEKLLEACPDVDQHKGLKSTTVKVLKITLADNWSQVRMAACVLCRVLWNQTSEHASLMVPLLPRMCLNRFYLAQGVKLYSQDTWKNVFHNGGGLEAVANHAAPICRYYIKMCDADNHAVREAACQAVAELASKVGTNPEYAPKLEPFVPALLQALLMCFHDESWPVRDEACLACGIFCRAYPDECRSELPLLKERWKEQLTDQIWSVREDAAVALGDAVRAYPELWDELVNKFLPKNLPGAKSQPAMTREEQKKHMNDIGAHSNQQLYSCGSLAPKLGKKAGAGRIGCTSCGITRPKAPWEATDGCIYLIRELIDFPQMNDNILPPIMTELADICRVQHFPQADDLRATLFRQLPVMAQKVGKMRFKRIYLEVFQDLLFRTLDSRAESALSVHAAGQCAEELCTFVGPMIFKGRLDEFQRETFDRVMRERQSMPRGPVMDTFSPFGPPPSVFVGASPTSLPTGAPFMAAVPGSGFTDNL